MPWVKDVLTGETRFVERREYDYPFRVMTEQEEREYLAPTDRLAELERQREDCLLRFGIKKPCEF